MYRPSNSDTNDFLEKLEDIISNNKKMIILGDININLLNNSNRNNNNNYLDIFNSNGFVVLNSISEYFATRIQNHNNNTVSRTIVDHKNEKFSIIKNKNYQNFYKL